jgi:hypothetical protein
MAMRRWSAAWLSNCVSGEGLIEGWYSIAELDKVLAELLMGICMAMITI